jgi:hypothetical protein
MIHLHLVYEVGSFKDIITCFFWALICPVAAFVGGMIYHYGKNYNDDETSDYDLSGMSKSFKSAQAGFMAMLVLGIASPFVGYMVISRYAQVMAQFNKREYKTIEGRIANFHSDLKKPYSDSFTIDTVQFRYGGGTLCYNKTQAEGSVIRNGLYVRIAYINTHGYNEIWRLETN